MALQTLPEAYDVINQMQHRGWEWSQECCEAGREAMAMVVAHVSQEPEPPSAHAPGQLPTALDDLVLACLSKAPDDRPADASELARQLAALELTRAWSEARALKWWQSADRAVDDD